MLQNDIGSNQQQTLLISLDLIKYKYYIFNLKGILKRRKDFSSLVKEYGAPSAVSNNGRVYIFKKRGGDVLNIFNLSSKNGFEFVKNIKLETAIS